ncbi:MAG: 23S rRNA (uracil(1939)-C(5))-methyltransferase RlmD [Lachnospiraceae bacterium]|nr:23S rRNA (uracil(1939)-C(5))-methyltransferase RlmD [Lachnospiraceae bacterium]
MNYQKNDIVKVVIEDIGTEGEGIGKIDGFTLFVKDAVVGDEIEAKIVKAKKNYAYARMEKLLVPSPYRTEPKCAYHRQCGGCQIQALSYEKQLDFKNNKVRNNLLRIGGFSEEKLDNCMEPIVGMENPYHYRNKAQYPVGTNKEGRIITGFYAGRTHSIIANIECYLGVPENKKILETILEYMESCHVSAYNEETGKGHVRHILIRSGFTSGEIMVCIIINGRDKNACKSGEFLPNQQLLLDKLAQIKGMTSVSVSINTEKTNVIMGKEIHVLWGEHTISDVIHVRDMKKEGYPFTGHELTFKISPLSFYQVNPVQTEKLYSLALEYAGLTGQETVWDLYCGIGTISLFLADKAKQVYGVEIVPQAIEDARENAKRNGITNAEFFVGKAEELLPEFYERMSGALSQDTAGGNETGQSHVGQQGSRDMLHPDVIVVDPPRKGCDNACLETMLKMQPKRIVYVSCDSATMARDVKMLCEGGYELKRVRAVDQFGHTVHVETCVLLYRTNS